MPKSGYQDILGQNAVYMIMVEDLWDQSSDFFSKDAGSKMLQHQVKTHKSMQSMSRCIKQQERFYKLFYMVNLHETLSKQKPS
jgi:hypothetical protein